jgi:HlyD family secretion protein
MSGLVQQVYYHVGEFVTAGSPVLTLRLTDQDKVRFYLSQDKMHRLSLGQNINIQVDGMNQSIPAKISYIASAAEFTPPVIYSKDSRTKLVFLIEAQLEVGQSLNPGMPVDVYW